MNNMARGFISFIVFVAAYFLSFWLFFAQIAPDHALWLGSIGALLAAIAAARFTWIWMADRGNGWLSAMAFGALITGGIGFVCGFFGPMIFTPEANQGPLLGIFITGPLGVVAGAAGGAAWHWWRGKNFRMQK